MNEVFAAIVDPAKMSHYFITSGSGPMKAGTTVEWKFADVGAKVSVTTLVAVNEAGWPMDTASTFDSA